MYANQLDGFENVSEGTCLKTNENKRLVMKESSTDLYMLPHGSVSLQKLHYFTER